MVTREATSGDVIASAQRRDALYLYLAVALAFSYYTLLITNGSFRFFSDPPRPWLTGYVYNSMLLHLLQGDFAVDPDAIRSEAFVRDGKTYTYFGVAPAFLRLPFLPLDNFATLDLTLLSIVVATCVSAYFKCASLLVIRNLANDDRLGRAVYGILVISVFLGGAQIQFLKASIFQEVICWGMALSSAFIYCAIRGLVLEQGFTTRLLATMACLAGMGLLTRVTTGVGLYVAITLLLLCIAAKRQPQSEYPTDVARASKAYGLASLTSPRIVAPLAILIMFAVLCGLVNYGRWGNALTFADVHLNRLMNPERLAVVDQYGEFNVRRVGYSLLYYFLPLNFIRYPDGTFFMADLGRSLFDGLELPPSSFFLTDPLIIFLAAMFFWTVYREHRVPGIDLQYAGALLIGFAAPVILILTYFYAAFRFRGEFYPLLEFAGFLFLYHAGQKAHVASAKSKQAFLKTINCCVIFGIIVSHVLLVAYKFSPFGNFDPFLTAGWDPAYSYFVAKWKHTAQDLW